MSPAVQILFDFTASASASFAGPRRLIADKGYDSDPLRERLARKGIEMICPYRSNNKEKKYPVSIANSSL